MSFEERKALRLALLKDVYDNYFNTGGSALNAEKGKLDKETILGYLYLEQKGLIKIDRKGSQMMEIIPSVYGIDLIENSENIKQ